jgi:polyisoprenoid-binding protein YceI
MRITKSKVRAFLRVGTLTSLLCALNLAGCETTEPPGTGINSRVQRSWVSDNTHSYLTFSVAHYGIHDLVGWFEDFHVTVHVNDSDLTQSKVVARVRPGSVRMPNVKMVESLLNLGFLKVDVFPEASFES